MNKHPVEIQNMISEVNASIALLKQNSIGEIEPRILAIEQSLGIAKPQKKTAIERIEQLEQIFKIAPPTPKSDDELMQEIAKRVGIKVSDLIAIKPLCIPKEERVRRSNVNRWKIKFLYTSQRGKCWYCLCELNLVYEVDHRVPIARGGTNDIGNLVLACPSCNSKKKTKLPYEFCGLLI